MTAVTLAYVGADIHDGYTVHGNAALSVNSAGLAQIGPVSALPDGCPQHQLDGGIITPGFVDLQVNGGGGVMFNDDPTVATLQKIATAHASMGTTDLLPTLITDRPEQTERAIAAVERAVADGMSGIAGLHLEGPHLSVARKGAHEAGLIRPMDQDDLTLLLNAADRLPNLMVTVAPENTSNAQIRTMAKAGIIVSLGHTDASYDSCLAAMDSGARAVTHLFNAMSQLTSREPGLVGAALAHGEVYAGLIADGIHVHPTTIRLALSAKKASDRVFLVTDAMATAGTDIGHFTLNGRDVFRRDDRLTLADGTLAGAHLDLPRALSVMVEDVGDVLPTAVSRATSVPASLLNGATTLGRLTPGTRTALYFQNPFSRPEILSF